MSNIQEGGAVDAKRAAREVHRLCAKIADQVDKGQWWNAMANAADLVAACQHGCRAEIARVARKRSGSGVGVTKKKASKREGARKRR